MLVSFDIEKRNITSIRYVLLFFIPMVNMQETAKKQVTLHNGSKATFNGIKPWARIVIDEDLVDGYIANGFNYVDDNGNVVDEIATTGSKDERVYSKKELQAILDEAGIEYAKKDNHATLLEIAQNNNLLDDGNDLGGGTDDEETADQKVNDLDNKAKEGQEGDEDDLDALGDDLDE